MSIITDRNSILAELATVNNLISSLDPKDFINKMSLESRKEELEEELNEIEGASENTAEVILYFGGAPVQGSRSISSAFAGKAISEFQDVVSAMYASEQAEALSESGPIPLANESELVIAGMPRGSFGFLLKENAQQGSLIKTKLSKAIDSAINIVGDIYKKDIDITLSSIHPRVLKSIKTFFETLQKNNASLKIESKDDNISLMQHEVENIFTKIDDIETSTSIVEKDGVFRGLMLTSKKFDFRIIDSCENISGALSPDMPEETLARINIDFTDKKCRAKFEIVESKRKNSQKTYKRWTLLSIEGLA